jgi:anaerobic ribonucleoside-triphosphate reductase activating protein
MNYFKIDECSISNGLGIRTVLWVSGCSHHCFNCQNPETWDSDNGDTFTDSAKQFLFDCLDKSYIKGITFSGGDPLYRLNIRTISELSKQIKDTFGDNKDQWLYTGYTWEEITNSELLDFVKTIDVIVDGPYKDFERNTSLAFRGSYNQRLIDVQKSLHTANLNPVLYTGTIYNHIF